MKGLPMSCDAAAAAAYLWLAATGPFHTTPTLIAATSPQVAAPSGSVAYEPLFADIIRRATRLKAEVESMRGASGAASDAFRGDIRELSDLDMQGHMLLAKRGTDGDLKCILKGIAQDLPVKLEALDAAKTPKDREMALTDLSYLLNDNVEVITAKPKPPV
jgi:hypothetical protein